VAAAYLKVPGVRAEALRLLGARLAVVQDPSDGRRPLFSTREDQRRANRDAAAALYADIGRALLAEGRVSAALDTLALAVAGPWDASLFREVAEARLSAGDTAGAAALWARAAADPQTPAGAVDSARARLGRAAAPAAWQPLLMAARADMRDRVLEASISREPRGRIRLENQDGRDATLMDELGGRIAVVVFWSRFCGPALEELPNIERLARELKPRGIRTVLITDEKPSTALRDFLRERHVTVPVYSDLRREAAVGFESFGTPDLFLVDASGRIRFNERPLENIPREAEALLEEGRRTR